MCEIFLSSISSIQHFQHFATGSNRMQQGFSDMARESIDTELSLLLNDGSARTKAAPSCLANQPVKYGEW
jgi:hypothetical protein